MKGAIGKRVSKRVEESGAVKGKGTRKWKDESKGALQPREGREGRGRVKEEAKKEERRRNKRKGRWKKAVKKRDERLGDQFI